MNTIITKFVKGGVRIIIVILDILINNVLMDFKNENHNIIYLLILKNLINPPNNTVFFFVLF